MATASDNEAWHGENHRILDELPINQCPFMDLYWGIPCCGRMGPLMNYRGNSPSGENHFNLGTLHMKQPVFFPGLTSPWQFPH